MTAYRNAELPPQEVEETLAHLDDLTRRLLYARGIATKEEAAAFLNPSYHEHLHDPFLLHDMDKAGARIFRAITDNERIAIFSDYDCDGIPGAVVLHDFFRSIQFENFSNYIPHRHYEGFGLSIEAVAKLHKENVKLIVTIDCGTSDVEAVRHAKQLGIDVIVTDHHEPKAALPEAHAIVNPKIGNTYPFTGLCGAAVVFKLVQALIQKGKEEKRFELRDGWEKWWLDMVGIATVSDMVPLVDENRVFARYGIEVLRKSNRPGLLHLLRKQRANQEHLTEDDIGFTIGPRINAASRMDTPEDAFYMLASKDEREASARVTHLEGLNNERRGVVAAMTKELRKRLATMTEVPPVLVMGDPSWRPSLVGLAAHKLAEEYQRPVFLWGRDGNGVIKGSCRSGGTSSIVRLMEEVQDMFLEYGGHHYSGGFSVHEDKIHTLPSALSESFLRLGDEVRLNNEVLIDASLHLADIDDTLVQSLKNLAPYGTGNPKPVFSFEGVIPKRVETFGKGKEHLKLVFETFGKAREAIAFYASDRDFRREPKEGESLTLIAHIEQNYYMNRLQTRLRILDIL